MLIFSFSSPLLPPISRLLATWFSGRIAVSSSSLNFFFFYRLVPLSFRRLVSLLSRRRYDWLFGTAVCTGRR